MNKTLLGYVPIESPIYAIHLFVKLFFMMIVILFPMFVSAPDWNIGLMIAIISLLGYEPGISDLLLSRKINQKMPESISTSR